MPPALNTRIQLTLFVGEPQAQPIEAVREQYNPEQFRLIKSHVTLCREDELQDLEKIVQNLTQNQLPGITISFGRPIRFSASKGVLLPASDDDTAFHALRAKVLAGHINLPRKQEAHITLMHPRNSTCTDAVFKEISGYRFPDTIRFDTISLIEQKNGGPWRTLQTFELD